MGDFMVIAIPLLVIGLIPALIAVRKGRDLWVWWLYGAALFIVALIHSIVMKPTEAVAADKHAAAGDKKCAHCAEWIKAEAKVCRYCGRDVEPRTA